MSKHLKLLLLLSILSATACLKAQSGRLNIHPDSIGEYWTMPLQDQVLWRNDQPYEMELKKVMDLPFRLYDGSEPYCIDGRPASWFKFQINNTSEKDSLHLFLLFDQHIHNATLFEKTAEGWVSYISGRHIDYRELAYKPSAWTIPISIAKNQSHHFFLKLNYPRNPAQSLNPILLASPASEAENRAKIYSGDSGMRIFDSFFMGIILIIALVTLAYYIGRKDKAYLYYSLYLFSLFIFYFKNFEAHNRSIVTFSLLAKYHTSIEPLITYVSFIFYAQFIRKFLDLAEADKKLDRVLFYYICGLLAMLPIDLFVQLIWGTACSTYLLKTFAVIFLLFSIYILRELWTKTISPYAKFIIVGTLFLIAGIIPFRFAQIIGTGFQNIYWGTIRVFYLEGGELYWYHTKIGFLLEIICFMIGLSWKTRIEQMEMHRLASQLRAIEINQSAQNLPAIKTEKDAPEKEQTNKDEFIKKVDAIIKDQFTKDQFTPSKLASELNISYSHCANLIKKKTGLSISLYIQQYRLVKAKELLRTSDLPIKQVAYQSGFNNPSYFSRLFKEVMGISPSDYRSSGHFSKKSS